MLVLLAMGLPGCDSEPEGRDPLMPTIQDVEPRDLNAQFDAASEEFDVPVPILKALGYAETGLMMVVAEPEFEGRASYGVMALRHDIVEEAASLAGLPLEDVAGDPGANIRAAAAWLSAEADRLGLQDRADLGAWADATASYSGIDDDVARSAYVYQSVYQTIRDGFEVKDAEGVVRASLEPTDAWPAFTVPPPAPAVEAGPDYAGSLWRPSPNYSSRPGGTSGKPTMVIIHTCEGSYNGCWSWLKNSASGVSAHYVVKEDGNEITQLVRENKKAWHIAASYKCNLNSNKECGLNGVSGNNFTIGIEHAGFANQASWNSKLINESAKLVCDITRDNGIPRDKYHIVGHGQLQPNNRVDPGPNWPWNDYLDKVDSYCNGGAPPPAEPPPAEPPPAEPPPGGGGGGGDTIIIDSNNANNDPELGFMSVSSNWVASSGSSQLYGSGYWYATTAAVSDPATMWFYSPEGGNYKVDTWHTEGTNRSAAAPFVIYDASGSTTIVNVDQRTNGGQWNNLGSFDFAPGWNKVQLSRWTSSPTVVIADAMRVTKN
ncbi:N-acetylmuramoyl-L-alanine amidase [Paraliomyxa miuraensis]|nr:N-acetylmuramoyl-L-alanine amidase [Paraliomyxa miuraensis]